MSQPVAQNTQPCNLFNNKALFLFLKSLFHCVSREVINKLDLNKCMPS